MRPPPALPIQRKEGLKLEFKRAEALKNPRTIARSIVALLNAKGGEIWIGIEEKDGIATAANGVVNPERAWLDLLNHLVNVIEPPLRDEIEHQVVLDHQGLGVLKITVAGDAHHGPYALLEGGARLYVIRVDKRTRAMTREEIRERMTPNGAGESQIASTELRERLDQILAHKGEPLFWLSIRPSRDLDVNVQDRELEALILDPVQSGNRRSGMVFSTWIRALRLTSGGLLSDDDSLVRFELTRTGCVDLRIPLDRMNFPGLQRERREIFPLALLEYPISLLRFAGTFYRSKVAPEQELLISCALVGVKLWTIPPWPPGTPVYMNYASGARLPGMLDAGNTREEDSVTWPSPLVLRASELYDNPDRIGFILVRRIYEAFGLREDRIPSEFDRNAQRLLLRD